MLNAIQRVLDFEDHVNPQFKEVDGLGRVGVAGFATGLILGVHLSLIGCYAAFPAVIPFLVVSRFGEDKSCLLTSMQTPCVIIEIYALHQ